MKLAEYRERAEAIVDEHCAKPGQTVRNWAASWHGIFSLLIEGRCSPNGSLEGRGVFEPCSLIVARWEFLGCLLIGHSRARSKRDQALEYARRFLEPVNSRYTEPHPSIAQTMQVCELLFQMIRNGSLHGFTPSGVYDDSSDNCIGFGLCYSGAGSRHLTFSESDALLVDATQLLDEFTRSMHLFARHLDDNKPGLDGKSACDNFREGFRWRFAPSPSGKGVVVPW
ncbi:MAG: hypothetical protein ABSC94_28705 [Polyangiaceae bacterium]|jgi:hypothetical protein